MPLTLVHHRFSVDDYEEMIEYGILTENDRVELIGGEIIEKMPIGDSHTACVKRSNRYFSVTVADRAVVGIQDPVKLDDSEPEPDVSLLTLKDDFYESGKPTPEDILMLMEVSDSSLEFDRDVKGPLYARNQIADYWIVNLNEQTIEVYRDPNPNGAYNLRCVYRRGDTIEPLLLPGIQIPVEEILGS